MQLMQMWNWGLQVILFLLKKSVPTLYSGLMDHLHNTAIETNLQLGTPVILPSSFAGSPTAMQQNYQDAMAVVAKYGKPDLYLTYTWNPETIEITEKFSVISIVSGLETAMA